MTIKQRISPLILSIVSLLMSLFPVFGLLLSLISLGVTLKARRETPFDYKLEVVLTSISMILALLSTFGSALFTSIGSA